MAIKKSDLYSKLWASCDKLRGGMDASQYKDYILTLLFVKYVTDKFKGVHFADINVPDGGSFDDMVAILGDKNIGEKMDKIIAKLAESNNLVGVITNARFNDDTKLGKGQEMVDKLTSLINIFRSPEFNFTKNRTSGDDIIGDAYEYLMRNFATESGKSKGQFYTPAEVSRILANVIGIGKAESSDTTVYDPACGSGSLLIRAADEANVDVSIYGQEKDVATAGLAKMNLVLHNKASGEIAGNQSTFSDPAYFDDDENSVLRRFDYIVANPPFSTKNWTDGLKEYGRFDGYGDRPPEKNGDYAWLMHILKSLKSKGKAAVILPHGVLFRGNAEGTIRKTIIEKGYIKGIIGLPANLFYGTGIPACIIVIDKENANARNGIFMLDASRDFIKDGNKNRLRERDIYKIITTFNSFREEEKYSRFVPIDEIKTKNDYNLNIPRYIDGSANEDLQNIDAHLNGGIPSIDIDSLDRYWAIFGNLKENLFEKFREGYYKPIHDKDEINRAVFCHKEFTGYADKVENAFTNWQDKWRKSLQTISEETKPKELISKLAESILDQFESVTLIDKYDVYEVLLSYWNETMSDDVYLLTQDGYNVAKEIEKLTEIVSSGKNKGKEKIIGWDGKLISKDLIAKWFFKDDLKAIEEVETIIATKQAELDEMIESVEDNSIINTVLNDKGDKIKKAELKKALKDSSGDDYDELEKLQLLQNEIDDKNKLLRGFKAALDKKQKEQYEKLTDDEILELLVKQKWYRDIYGGIENLYTAISHSIAGRIVELAERYEQTLPELEKQTEELENKVKSHLERMGFEW